MASRKKKPVKMKDSIKSILRKLLETSIKIDDYIYNQEPMTINEALYMKDKLLKYKLLFPKNDFRNNQVIEKNTKLLEGIIKEQEDINRGGAAEYVGDNNNSNISNNIVEANNSIAYQHVPVSEHEDLCANLSKSISEVCSFSPICENLTNAYSLSGVSRAEITSVASTSNTVNNSNTIFSNYSFTIDSSSHINKTTDVVSEFEALASEENTNFTSEERTNKSNDDVKVASNISVQFGNPSQKDIYQSKCKRRKNALSWINDMKYIRIVSDEEFDPNLSYLLQKWDSCALPKEWEESDFS